MTDKSLVTPEEAILLADHRGISDMFICDEILNIYNATIAKESNALWCKMWLLATIWNAGRVQGIREERKKRRRK